MNLLIDIGNSRLKWATAHTKHLTVGDPLANGLLTEATLAHAWQALQTPKQIAIACVANTQLVALVKQTAWKLWPNTAVIEAQAKHCAFGVVNAYEAPLSLGIDRWLALIAAHQLYRTNTCIVDCGTAITIDLLSADGLHRGGFICPGLSLMRQALYKQTHNLPFSNTVFSLAAATSTEAAIFSGTVNAALGLIAQVMTQQLHPTELILTGGDAALLAGYMQSVPLIHAHLVLYGLAIVLSEPASHDSDF